MKREFAIVQLNSTNNILELVEQLKTDKSNITLFVKDGIDPVKIEGINVVLIPMNIDSGSKVKNFVIRHYHDKPEHDIWLHILEDSLEIVRDPTSFMDDIERMMDVLDLNSWLNTTTDICNRVYRKYNPRLRINVDKPECKKLGIDQIVFCSHSNTQWIILNLAKADAEELRFDERFTVAMYYIIEYLARRRNSHPESLYFMNQYITCKSEENLFRNKVINSSDRLPESKDEELRMKEEDIVFKSMNIDFSPTNSIDMVLERTWNKLKSKI